MHNTLNIVKHSSLKFCQLYFKEIGNISAILKHLLYKTIGKKHDKKMFYLIALTNLRFKILAL